MNSAVSEVIAPQNIVSCDHLTGYFYSKGAALFFKAFNGITVKDNMVVYILSIYL